VETDSCRAADLGFGDITPCEGTPLGCISFGGRLGGCSSSFGDEISFGSTSGEIPSTGTSWAERSIEKCSILCKIGLAFSSDTGRIDGSIVSDAGILGSDESFMFDTVGGVGGRIGRAGKFFSLGSSLAGAQVKQLPVSFFNSSLGWLRGPSECKTTVALGLKRGSKVEAC
jgi:hypothetical protein